MAYLIGGGTLEGVVYDDEKVVYNSNNANLSYLSSSISSSSTASSYQENDNAFKITLRRLGLDADQFSWNLLDLADNRPWRELDGSRNQMSAIPPAIQRFVGLTHVNLSCNHITVIPEAMFQLTQLQCLHLSENQITVIPDAMPYFLSHLLVLCLDDNQLTELPDTIGHWKKLRELRLGSEFGGNRIQQLPSSLSSMHSLVELDVSFNQLRALSPAPFQDLTRLRYLNLSHNQITALPQEGYTFQSCVQLSTLDLSANFITELSLTNARDLTRLMTHGRLELLNLSDNHLQRIPTDVLDQAHSQVIIHGNPMADFQHQETTTRETIQLDTQSSVAVSEFDDSSTTRGNDDEELREQEEPTSYLLHSLREIAIRAAVLLQNGRRLSQLPQHIADDIENTLQICPQCQMPFAHEWVSTTQLKTYRGYPSVVRTVRFCKTQCWLDYRDLLAQQVLASQSNVLYPRQQQALEYITQHPQVRDSNSFDWIMAAVLASNEQEQQTDLLANTML